MKKLILIAFLFSMSSGDLSCQNLTVLHHLLKKSTHDSLRCMVSLEIGNYYQQSNLDSAFHFHKKALQCAKNSNLELKIAEALKQLGSDYFLKSKKDSAILYYNDAMAIAKGLIAKSKSAYLKLQVQKLITLNAVNIGNYYKDLGKHDEALKSFEEGLNLSKEIKFRKGESNALGNMSVLFMNLGEYDKAKLYGNDALKISESIKEIKYQAIQLGNLGVICTDQGDFTEGLKYYEKALAISKRYGLHGNVAMNLANIGVVYDKQGDFPKALEYYYGALVIHERIDDKRGQAANIGNIANVYRVQQNFKKALEFYYKSMDLCKQMGNQYFIVNSHLNIGMFANRIKNKDLATQHFDSALVISEEINYAQGKARVYGSLANINYSEGKFNEAVKNTILSLKINESLKDAHNVAIDLGNIGLFYLMMRKYSDSEMYLKQAIEKASSIHSLDLLKDDEEYMSGLYEDMKKPGLALIHYKLFIKYRDSIFNDENTKKSIKQELNFSFEKRAAADSVKNAKAQSLKNAEIATQNASLKQEKTFRIALYGGIILVICFLIFVFNRFRVASKQKKIIESQKKLVDEAFHKLEEKNKEVLDSIYYARRIQRTLITSEYYFMKHLSKRFKSE